MRARRQIRRDFGAIVSVRQDTAYRGYAWAGSLPTLVETPRAALLSALQQFVPDASTQQVAAWTSSLDVLQEQGAFALRADSKTHAHSSVLEYELPREAGRRPDVLVLHNGTVLVLEFKETGRIRRADLDQVQAYARDLRGYHSACRDLSVVPLLVLCGKDAQERDVDGVLVVPATVLGARLVEFAQAAKGPPVAIDAWLEGDYAPLPTLVTAARMLFERQDLPFIRRAHSAGVPRTVEHVLTTARRTAQMGGRRLLLLTGVPGAGKTLVGLQVAHSAALEGAVVAHEARKRATPATFLSGNGPLVQVLQDALKSRTFVQDMHRYVRRFGLERRDQMPPEHLIVFDEAQRAWDAAKVADFYAKRLPGIDPSAFRSEPEMLVDAAERIPGWSMVLALVGTGQEIHTGEEAGVVQWAEALAAARERWNWSVSGPPGLRAMFADRQVAYEEDELLDLNVTLRSHAAENLHVWVSALLDGGDAALADARLAADELRRDGFPIYATRDLESAKRYARDRFRGEPLRRYGLVASSKAKNLESYGVDPTFQATRRINVARWFNDSPGSARSCCQLVDVATEFQCQGLELDLPILCWGDDFSWDAGRWHMSPVRPSRLVRDPYRLRRNAYRVLLTRGREGLVIWVPDRPRAAMDGTMDALIRAGAISGS